ncbi:MAG: hypothetical protein K2I72_01945 [Bacilli bacterium]|nr:hypothetical protein [Bacilli bacterium]
MKWILGEVSNEVVKNWNLEEYRNKKIVMYHEAKEHSKDIHLEQYDCEEDYYFVMDSLKEIIKYPDYVFYDKSKNGLEYYKNVRGNILVAVRVKPGKELRVKSVYPVKAIKIENRKRKEEQMKIYNKYVVDVDNS